MGLRRVPTLLALLLLPALLYAAVLGWLWWRQESLLFQPEVLAADHRLARDGDVQELAVEVPGARLSVLQLRLQAPRGVVFFLHGNGGSLAGWFVDVDFYRRANVDLVMMDYRGYGKSSGRIAGERQLRDDVRAVWDRVAPRYAGKPVVVYGRSLGTALAAGLAREREQAGRPPALTVLVSPYRSMRALAAELYPWVPGGLLRYPLATEADVAQLSGPVLLVHADRDALIPLAHSEALLRAAPQARLLRVPGAAHNDLQDFAVYRDAMARALAGL